MKIEIINSKEIKVNGILFTPAEEKPKPKQAKDEEHPAWSNFLKLWNIYGKKGNKRQSFKNFIRLTKAQREQMYTKVEAYVKSTPEKQYRKDLQVYLNKTKEHWNDVIIKPEKKFQKPVVGSQSHRPAEKKKLPEFSPKGLDRIRQIKAG